MELFNQESKSKERVFQKFPLKDGEVWLMPNFMPIFFVKYTDIF